jgi:hypothetical protein
LEDEILDFGCFDERSARFGFSLAVKAPKGFPGSSGASEKNEPLRVDLNGYGVTCFAFDELAVSRVEAALSRPIRATQAHARRHVHAL